MKYLLIYFGFSCLSSFAQDTLSVKKLNTQSFLLVKTDKIKQDSTSFKTPKHKQGIICDFEDKLNRKKVPIDFSLGNSKY